MNLISKYATSASELFLKCKDIVDLCKKNFDIGERLIQCNKLFFMSNTFFQLSLSVDIHFYELSFKFCFKFEMGGLHKIRGLGTLCEILIYRNHNDVLTTFTNAFRSVVDKYGSLKTKK